MKADPTILLAPNVPKPLHGLSPRTIRGKQWWDEERQKAYAAADYHCEACGVAKWDAKYHQWLEAHEVYLYDYAQGFALFIGLVALCHSCHNYIHSGRMEVLVQSGKMTKEKLKDIMAHGNRVLRDAGLRKVEPVPDRIAPWEDWCLIFEGEEYPTKFASYDDWFRSYFHGEVEVQGSPALPLGMSLPEALEDMMFDTDEW